MKRLLFRLRPEEAVALAFVLPTTWLTVAAYLYAREAGVLGPRYPGGVVRLAVAVALLAGARARPAPLAAARAVVRGLRETVPLLACFLIYTNLHDTIGFVNPHDVHHWLVALDRMIFGVQPCVWAERLITPARTEVMQFLYLNFFWIAPSTSLVLLLQRRWPEFRAATLGIVACFFMGYALYVAFPAAPPRLVLVYEFTKNLRGYPVGFSNLSAQAFSLLPVDSRAAFPSLHTAASLVALVYAWRYLRWWFWVLLPFVARPVGLDDLPPPPLLRGPRGGLAPRPGRGVGRPPRRRLVGAAAAGARLRAGARGSPPDDGPSGACRTGSDPTDRRPGSWHCPRDPRAARVGTHFAGWTSIDQASLPQARVRSAPVALRGERDREDVGGRGGLRRLELRPQDLLVADPSS